MTYLGVCGWPVAHSRSPAMHTAALRAAGLDGWRYLKLPLPPALFTETVRALPAAGFRGANVTIPHKHVALALAGSATPAARAIGAANTLTFAQDGGVEADNTDAAGFLAALPAGFAPPGRRALVLGAGGAARAVTWALVGAGAADVMVWNRTPQRARDLAAALGARAVAGPEPADLIVNCTAVGLDDPGETFTALPLDPAGFAPGTCVVDLVYRPGGTRLLETAAACGADTVDGLEVLAGQGAASFERWTGRAASREAMLAAARAG